MSKEPLMPRKYPPYVKRIPQKADVPPSNVEVDIKLLNLRWGKHSNVIVTASYNDELFDFSVFNTNGYRSVDGVFCFKIYGDIGMAGQSRIGLPIGTDSIPLKATFERAAKSGYLRCMAAREVE